MRYAYIAQSGHTCNVRQPRPSDGGTLKAGVVNGQEDRYLKCALIVDVGNFRCPQAGVTPDYPAGGLGTLALHRHDVGHRFSNALVGIARGVLIAHRCGHGRVAEEALDLR